jgi:hypothetical protein
LPLSEPVGHYAIGNFLASAAFGHVACLSLLTNVLEIFNDLDGSSRILSLQYGVCYYEIALLERATQIAVRGALGYDVLISIYDIASGNSLAEIKVDVWLPLRTGIKYGYGEKLRHCEATGDVLLTLFQGDGWDGPAHCYVLTYNVPSASLTKSLYFCSGACVLPLRSDACVALCAQ